MDFTKHELEWILEALHGWYSDMDSCVPEGIAIKTQELINSYCDECDGKGEIDNLCDGIKGCCIYPCGNCKGTGKIENE